MHTDRIEFRTPDLFLQFSGFSRADMIELVPGGKQEDSSIGIASAAVRNLMVQHRLKSYSFEQTSERRRTRVRFEPADVRQDTVLVITVPEGTRLGFNTGTEIVQQYVFREAVFIHAGRIEKGLKTAALGTLQARIAKGEIIVPVMPPFSSSPRVIHAERPELDDGELLAVRRLLGKGTAAVFEAIVTETGQVIEVIQTSTLPRRLPRSVMRKLEDAAMRFSYEPQVVNGRAQGFRTNIVLEIPQ